MDFSGCSGFALELLWLVIFLAFVVLAIGCFLMLLAFHGTFGFLPWAYPTETERA